MAEGSNQNEDILETTVVTEKIGKITCVEGYERVTTKTSKHKKGRNSTPNNKSPRHNRRERLDPAIALESSPEGSSNSSTSETEGDESDSTIRRVTDEVLSNLPKLPDDKFKRIDNPSISYDLISESEGVRGFGLIFVNHFETHSEHLRKGADEDVKLISHLFEDMGIKSLICENKSAIKMLDILKEYRNDHAHLNRYGSLFVAISTHGSEGDLIYGSDCRAIPLDNIISLFDNDKCIPMVGKPKVFVVQACRGELKDHQVGKGTLSVTPEKGHCSRLNTPIASAVKQDCLVAHASNPGYTARRDEHGSWFFQALYYAYSHFGNTFSDFEQILKLTNRIMVENFTLEGDDRLQPCNINSSLTKLLLMPYHPRKS